MHTHRNQCRLALDGLAMRMDEQFVSVADLVRDLCSKIIGDDDHSSSNALMHHAVQVAWVVSSMAAASGCRLSTASGLSQVLEPVLEPVLQPEL